MKARLARFYGWTDYEILSMEYETVLEYYQAITVIDAEQQLNSIRCSSYPNMTKDAKDKTHRELKKLAEPAHLQKEMDFDEFIGMMNGR